MNKRFAVLTATLAAGVWAFQGYDSSVLAQDQNREVSGKVEVGGAKASAKVEPLDAFEDRGGAKDHGPPARGRCSRSCSVPHIGHGPIACARVVDDCRARPDGRTPATPSSWWIRG